MGVEEFQPTRKWFLKLTLLTKWITPCERALKTCVWKWCQKLCAFLYEATRALGKMWLGEKRRIKK